MSKAMTFIFAGIIGIFAFIAFMAIGVVFAIIRSFVLVKLWGWFVLPYFCQVKLSIPLAIGICLVIGMFHLPYPERFTDKEGTIIEAQPGWKAILTNILSPFAVLLMGWIVKTYFLGN